jgi:hypothetical protein
MSEMTTKVVGVLCISVLVLIAAGVAFSPEEVAVYPVEEKYDSVEEVLDYIGADSRTITFSTNNSRLAVTKVGGERYFDVTPEEFEDIRGTLERNEKKFGKWGFNSKPLMIHKDINDLIWTGTRTG